VYAAGDVASAWHAHYGRHLHVEHWANAFEEGGTGGCSAAGGSERYTILPHFFSDQYDLGMEYVGRADPGDAVMVRGDLAALNGSLRTGRPMFRRVATPSTELLPPTRSPGGRHGRMSLSLVDWRRRVAGLYAEVRRSPDVRTAHELWRVTRDELFATHPDSPIPPADRPGFVGLAVAPYDPALRFEAEVDTDVEPRRLEVATGTDGIVPFDRFGVVHLPNLGDLDVWWLASYGGGVFLPVKDALAGTSTYAGGRYVIDTVKGADLGGDNKRFVVDFNFAYNPSCAYDAAWACPLAPPGNIADAPILGGELCPTG